MTHVNEEQRARNLDLVDRARRAQLAVNDIISSAQRPEGLRIIAVGGWYECGKDAFADHLVARNAFRKTWMSYSLHNWLLTQNPWIKLDVEVMGLDGNIRHPGEFETYAWLDYNVGYVEMKRQEEVRRALQKTGTDCGRKLADWDMWVKAMSKILTSWIDGGERAIIVTGVRYPNELDALVKLGAETVWVERPEARRRHEARLREDSERVTQGLDPLMHDSETALGPEDFSSILMNDSDLEELRRRAEAWHDSRWGS